MEGRTVVAVAYVEVGKRDEREELLQTIKGRFCAKEMENQQNKKKQKTKKEHGNKRRK